MADDPIRPKHYRGRLRDGTPIQAADVGEAFGLNHHLATAVEYILRAGKKPGQPAEVDLGKAVWWLQRDQDCLAVAADGFVPADDGAEPPLWREGSVGEATESILSEVRYEVLGATLKHPPIASAHEGYAILMEEVDELWAEIRRRKPDPGRLRAEALQVAAMAVRFIRDVLDQPAGHQAAEQPDEPDPGEELSSWQLGSIMNQLARFDVDTDVEVALGLLERAHARLARREREAAE